MSEALKFSVNPKTVDGDDMNQSMASIDMRGGLVAITGAAQGIGRGMAEAFASWGARIAVMDKHADQVEATLAALSADPQVHFGAVMDVTDERSVDAAIDAAWSALGGIDLLINNAGVLSVSPVAELKLQEWRRIMDVNTTGTFLMSRAMVRRLLAHKSGGSIVNIASIGGRRGDPGIAHYAASKFAVIGFTQALAREVAKDDILVNAVCPGVVDTPMIAELADKGQTSMAEWVKGQCIPRAQTPRDIAFAAAFLHCSRAVTGQAINVDGGTLFN
jgi:meso-butanediol dehydrogenase/(S,S)-butanediol dehydrogenase/diacetyl reductase